MPHTEHHLIHRGSWLRAAVLGANDGLVSTASLVMGVAAAEGSSEAIIVAGLAGLVGGAMSMAVGEYVSVSSQRDVEQSDLEREATALRDAPEEELEELAGFYVQKGLEPELAQQVAEALTKHDALAAHAREELNIDPEELAQPFQAGFVSAVSFASGAAVPLLAAGWSGDGVRMPVTLVATLVGLVLTGASTAWLGGARLGPAVGRVVAGGTLAMAVTAAIGALFGVAL